MTTLLGSYEEAMRKLGGSYEEATRKRDQEFALKFIGKISRKRIGIEPAFPLYVRIAFHGKTNRGSLRKHDREDEN